MYSPYAATPPLWLKSPKSTALNGHLGFITSLQTRTLAARRAGDKIYFDPDKTMNIS
jgi:hypothetical protein